MCSGANASDCTTSMVDSRSRCRSANRPAAHGRSRKRQSRPSFAMKVDRRVYTTFVLSKSLNLDTSPFKVCSGVSYRGRYRNRYRYRSPNRMCHSRRAVRPNGSLAPASRESDSINIVFDRIKLKIHSKIRSVQSVHGFFQEEKITLKGLVLRARDRKGWTQCARSTEPSKPASEIAPSS